MKTVNPADAGMNEAQLNRIEQHLQQQYLANGKISGCSTLIARNGQLCYFKAQGLRDRERNKPMEEDTLFRIYSMSKPITSIAMMQLYEQGKFSLTDPVHRFIPEWKNLEVYKGGAWPLFMTEPCRTPMTIRDLFMHTSGLTYDFLRATNVDYAYRKKQIGFPYKDNTLQTMIDDLAKLPLEFQPGTRWNYSVATDVLGYLIEKISGESLPDYLQKNIFSPLGMNDTCFSITEKNMDRFASCYTRNYKKQLVLQDDCQESDYRNRVFFSGGGGLISSMHDYYQFCRMLLNGGELNGQRIIGSRTLDYMTRNHLPGNQDMAAFATGTYSETPYQGVGFGLGFANSLDTTRNGNIGSEGAFYWGGAASTLFWIDPKEELIVIFMTQLIPSTTFNFRGQLQAMIYPAIVEPLNN
jgi:CubicO group peptidase (beta-lactamase class C family)